ncbi:MAG: hypothetical protein DIU62_004435 [Pseudomonadota bacterium]|jgi:hypothetical protein|nr:MAG: hypothetical protein DIU62_02680 [Pseudomonadota bacterium]
MFFVLYALALLALAIGLDAGLSIPSIALLYAAMATATWAAVGIARARHRAASPPLERRRSPSPLHPVH